MTSTTTDESEAPLGPLGPVDLTDIQPPILHLLIPVSETSANLCKTLVSSMILNYPPPELINFGHKDKDINVAHTAKIRGVSEFLQNSWHIKDDDLILMIDGYDVWFQLPPEIMISRFQIEIDHNNERLRRKFGTVPTPDGSGHTPRISEKIIFGADKLCWPNALSDPACAAVPESPLPPDSWGPQTDKDPLGYQNRPTWLNSGTIMGKAVAMRALYSYAMQKIDQEGRGVLGDQFVLAEIFGEQEYQREVLRQNTSNKWLDWLSSKLGTSGAPNISNVRMDAVPGRNYEYGIGLDYESQLFCTMTHSHRDVDWLSFNDTDSVSQAQAQHGIPNPEPIALPLDIQRAWNPFVPVHHPKSIKSSASTGDVPDKIPDPAIRGWENVPLATNVHSEAVPALLHFNGEKAFIDKWWPRMWFHPWARALLGQQVRQSTTSSTGKLAREGDQAGRPTRGRLGGVWTSKGKWMGWHDVCGRFEAETFNDGI